MTQNTPHASHSTHHHPHQASPGVGGTTADTPAGALPITDVSDQLLSLAERKAQLVERIERQRLLRQTRRIQAAIAELQARGGQGSAAGGDTGFPRSKTLRLITGQPLLAAGAVGVVLMLGPSRLMRLASWVVPMLLRRR
ncbi:hypothetical protein [Curvibacter gracilis]|uniref:hypothetical protein n=1 Tax=Curvibacter gracilis TaxID=230310 RepID=UPI0012F98E07|nr:hypothetical protein [Curvibacter gracilis]